MENGRCGSEVRAPKFGSYRKRLEKGRFIVNLLCFEAKLLMIQGKIRIFDPLFFVRGFFGIILRNYQPL